MEESFGAIIYKAELYLLILQKNGDWGFPKGHANKGETPEVTAKREVLEETGYNIKIDKCFQSKIEYALPTGIIKKVTFFIGYPESSNQQFTIDPSEIIQHLWLDYESALAKLTFDNSKRILIEARNFLVAKRNDI